MIWPFPKFPKDTHTKPKEITAKVIGCSGLGCDMGLGSNPSSE